MIRKADQDPALIKVQQQSGRWAVNGQVPVYDGRMDAIRNAKTMAGSPDADQIGQRPAILRMVFVFLRRTCFREPMKEDRNVQYPFSGDRLGRATAQA
jgi:hypothetical protein